MKLLASRALLSTCFTPITITTAASTSHSLSRRAFLSTASSSLLAVSNSSNDSMPSTDNRDANAVRIDASNARMWDRFADGYSKQPIKDEKAYEKKLQVTQSYLKPTDRVLEFGCGTGGIALLHSPFVKSILATDVSSKMIDIARDKAEGAGVTNVEFQQASVDSLSLPAASQDVVLGLSILHLLPDREATMRKVHGWLKPGGLFVTSTICASDMGALTEWFLNKVFPVGNYLGIVPKVNTFSKDELKDSFRKTGFDIEYEWQPAKDAAVFIIGRKKKIDE